MQQPHLVLASAPVNCIDSFKKKFLYSYIFYFHYSYFCSNMIISFLTSYNLGLKLLLRHSYHFTHLLKHSLTKNVNVVLLVVFFLEECISLDC